MPRGGRRQPKPGGQYANRADLRVAPSAVPGQTYGEAGSQLAAQQAVPIAGQPAPHAPGGASPSAPPGAPPGPPPIQPGQFGPLDRPTDNPDEPLTAGAPFGPGPTGVPSQQPQTGSQLINSLSAKNPGLQYLASVINRGRL